MDKESVKILISSFIIGIAILTVALFTNQTSDIALTNSQIASVQLAQGQPAETTETAQPEAAAGNNPNAAQVGNSSNSGSGSTGYQAISGLDTEEIKRAGGADGSFIGLLRMIFNWTIAIIIALATLFTVLGAIQYMTTDAVSGKDEGRKRMQSAIGGLILALMAWLILYSINQNILSSNFLLRLNGLNSGSSQNSGQVTTPAKTQYEENEDKIEQLKAQSEFTKDTVEFAKEIRDKCFDENGDFIEPPVDSDCNAGIKFFGSEVLDNQIKEGVKKQIELNQEIIELEKTNQQIKGDENVTQEEINALEQELEDLNDFINTANQNNTGVNSGGNSGSSFNPNSDSGFDIDIGLDVTTTDNSGYISIQDLIEMSREREERYRNENNNEEPELSIDDLNVLAFQDQAFENIFIRNEDINISQISEELKSLLLVTRDYCCGGKTTIAGVDTYKSSYNVTNIDIGNNSFFIERSVTDGLGANHWTTLHRNITSNLYPDQNLVDITEYLDCRDSRNRFTSWTCRKPDNFREIEGRYYNLTTKGIRPEDVLQGATYSGQDRGLSFQGTYGGGSWNLKI